MNLDTTLKVLRIVLGEVKTTNDCDITASYADSMINNFSLGNTPTRSNGVTPVTVVAAPPIDTQRQVKEIRLFNNDTVPHNVTLQLFDGTNTWIVGTTATAGAVPVGGSFVYTPESGVCCSGGGGGSSLTVEDDTGHTIASTGTLKFEGVVVSGSTPSAITNMTTITGHSSTGTTAGIGILLVGGAALGSGVGGSITMDGGMGGPSSTAANGGGIYFTAGSGGTGTVNTNGGAITGVGGDGGAGTYAVGGSLNFSAGQGGVSSANGPGGAAAFSGGAGHGIGAGGPAGFYGGTGIGTGAGGDIIAVGGSAASGAGGNILLTPGPGSPPGTTQVNGNSSLIAFTYSWVAGAQLNNQTIGTSDRAMRVTGVIGRIDAANGGAATLVIKKAASGTAPAAGTNLTSTTLNLAGVANTNQTLTLSGTLADITIAAGDSFCMVTTGALAASAGCITVWGTPQ